MRMELPEFMSGFDSSTYLVTISYSHASVAYLLLSLALLSLALPLCLSRSLPVDG